MSANELHYTALKYKINSTHVMSTSAIMNVNKTKRRRIVIINVQKFRICDYARKNSHVTADRLAKLFADNDNELGRNSISNILAHSER